MEQKNGKRKIKVKFCDFWNGFIWNSHGLWKYIHPNFELELSENPDILIFSCYGTEFLKYNCPRLYYTAENIRPNYRFCDFAVSFDYDNRPNHLRVPLYSVYFNNETLTRKRDVSEILNQNREFCSFVVSNSRESEERIRFFHALSDVKKVASGGKYANNVGEPVSNKRAFIRNYKFNIAFENSSYPGYTTEKIAEAWVEGCIPIYWGNPRIEEEINPDCFINVGKFSSHKEAIEYILEIDNSKEMYRQYLKAPFFRENMVPDELRDVTISMKLKTFIEEALNLERIAAQWWHRPYFYIRKIKGGSHIIKVNIR